ncbi:MAG: lysine--tRNA ligase [Patescibacteria group bacterium]
MLDDLIAERRKKLEKLKQAGIDPYPPKAERTVLISDAHKKFAQLVKAGKNISLSGRLRGVRDQGNIAFFDLEDESGRLQLVLKKDSFAKADFWKSVLDIGDFISATGKLFKTKRGEESLEVSDLSMVAKSLRPLPSDWYGLEDIETRLRERHLDLLLNSETKELFRKKEIFWRTFRDSLEKEGFLEVEAPVLESIPGGADAEPFKTHMNALDHDFYLRISLELPLKKLLVGGYEKVFEIGRIFRNEGIDKEHLQDYTQLEFYWAYRDYNDLMALLEKMYKSVVKAVTGGLQTSYGGQKIDWSKKWPKISYVDEFKKHVGLDPLAASEADLVKKARELGIEPEKHQGKGRVIDLIFKKAVRPHLLQPSFLIDPPVEIEPLAKRSGRDPRVVERVQIMAGGTELGKGFTELNDPVDQRARFEEQVRLREKGDKEAQRLDEEYLTAMEYGMPPAAGFGVSERLFAVLMDKPIRETVIFPLMKPKK